MKILMAIAMAGVSALAALTTAQAQQAPTGLNKIDTIVVLYMENRSFDHLFGMFPGANGLANAGDAAIQVDETGKPYASLPTPLDFRKRPPAPYDKLPVSIPNGYFRLDEYYNLSDQLGSLVHAFYQQQDQINGGRMNRFALTSDAKGYAMGVWDGSPMKMWDYAKKYTLADNFFHAAFGGSFLNHFWLVCACTPVYPNAPANIVAKVDPEGRLIVDGWVTPDGYGVNTMEPVGGPFDANTKKERLLPVQTMTTIGDRLSEKGIDWRWYSGGWNEVETGTLKPGTPFSYHHQAFAFFDRFQKGKPDRARHIKDLEDFLVDIDKGTLPPVVFYKPRAGINQHPSNSNVLDSDARTADLIARLEKSPQWGKMAVIVTYDENGGFWDHVPPPKRDRWGPGTRVPTIVISPFARKGFVDHTQYDTTSILKLIGERHGLAPLTKADAKANSMTAAFEF